jgi:methyl-accepting chemotaxis protein
MVNETSSSENTINAEAQADLARELKKTTDMLAELRMLRERVSALSITSAEAIERYTAINGQILLVIELIGKFTQDPELKNDLFGMAALELEKEFAGVERALGNAAIINDRFSAEGFANFLLSIAGQTDHHSNYQIFAEEKVQKSYREKMGSTAAVEALQLRRTLLEKGQENRLGLNADRWFSLMTSKIDLLKEAIDDSSEHIQEEANKASGQAKAALVLYSVITLVTALLAIVLAYFVARSVSAPLSKASDGTKEISAQMLAAVQQQSASAAETATAVSQTTTTVDEIRRTSELSVQKAKAVADVADRGTATAQQGIEAIQHGIEAMRRIRNEVEGIAKNILELSERNLQIGEIVQSVNALAEQSNLLAVNASIEAAKAGEHGRGFAVVAGEVKALAEQSKEATVQIRGILHEIQKSSNAAVMVTEQGTKRVEEGTALIEELGRTIEAINQVNEESSDAARQISSAANQQLVGIEQITGAMRNIEQAVKDNAAGVHQLENSAKQLQTVSMQLVTVVKGQHAVHA